MDVLEQILTGDEECQFSVCTAELEAMVKLLTDEVELERCRLRRNQAELLSLETETSQRSSERDLYLSQTALTVNLSQRLVEEAETKERLERVSQELNKINKTPDTGSSETSAADMLEKLEADTENAIASLKQKEDQLLQQKEKLLESMAMANNALSEGQLKEKRAQEELCDALRVYSDQGSSRCQQKSEADALLDACVKEMGLLQLLNSRKKEKRK